MARLKFNRGLRASINKINTNKTATEGSLYFATDDGTLWYGTASGTLTQVRDNIDHNTTYTSLKNPYSLTLQGNGTTLANGTYDGSSAKTVNITPASIGASASGHKHDAGDITSGTLPVARGGTGQTNLDSVTVGKSKESITYHFSAGTSNNNLKWVKLGTLTSSGDDSGTIIDVFTGNGYNGGSYQNSYVRIFIKDGYQGTPSATSAFGVTVDYGPQNTDTNFKVKVLASSATVCDVWINVPWGYANGSYRVTGYYNKWANSGAGQSAEPTSGTVQEVSYATIAKTSDIPTSLPASDVSSWAKASTKPSYTASEVGALPISGGTMNGTAMIQWADAGNWEKTAEEKAKITYPVVRGGFYWSGQSDGIKLFAEETDQDNLDLVLHFTDDDSNKFQIRNSAGNQTASISARGVFTGTFSGNLTGNATNDSNGSKISDTYLRFRDAVKTNATDTLWSQIGIREYDGALPKNISGDYNYGAVISLPGTGSRFDLWYNHQTSENGQGLKYRTGWNADQKAWATIIDSKNIGNQSVASASKVNGHTVNSDVPANAKFTDTNTWRGITDSYSGTATDTSISQKGANTLFNAVSKQVVVSSTQPDASKTMLWIKP